MADPSEVNPADPVEALRETLRVAVESAVHAGINGPMHSGQNSMEALDLIEHIARAALAALPAPAPDTLDADDRLLVEEIRNGTYGRPVGHVEALLSVIDRLTAAAPVPEGVPEEGVVWLDGQRWRVSHQTDKAGEGGRVERNRTTGKVKSMFVRLTAVSPAAEVRVCHLCGNAIGTDCLCAPVPS